MLPAEAALAVGCRESLVCRCLVDELKELVEFRGDDDLRATVALAANSGIIAGDGIVLTTATRGQALRVYAIAILKFLYDTGGTQCGEVPVVADILTTDGHVVGVTLDEHLIVAIIVDDLGKCYRPMRCRQRPSTPEYRPPSVLPSKGNV